MTKAQFNKMLQIEFAMQQLTGYILAKSGGSVRELISSMGVTKEEWDEIKVKYTYIPKQYIEDIDNMFTTD